jgi:hypothetical protein
MEPIVAATPSSTETRVVHCRKEAFDVYIGRPSPFGNPFAIGGAGDRPTVIAKYREWILTQPHLLKLLPTLRGKRLGCWCWPKACHGDVLVELINLLPKETHA